MRRSAVLLSLLILFSASLSASYSIALPERGHPCFTIIDNDGETIELDGYVWYKRWNGLLLERIDDGIYSVTEGDSSVLLVEECADISDIKGALRFGRGTALIISALPVLDTEAMEDEGVMDAIIMHRLPEREAARLSALGFRIGERRPGEVVRIGNQGLPLQEERPIIVTCPHCRHSFSISI